MFNLSEDDFVPGFRMKEPKDEVPGFRMVPDGSIQQNPADIWASAYRRYFVPDGWLTPGAASNQITDMAFRFGDGLAGAAADPRWQALPSVFPDWDTSVGGSLPPRDVSGLSASGVPPQSNSFLSSAQVLPVSSPAIPVADVPRAANDNPVCNHAYGRCMATARMGGLSPDAYARFIRECKSIYELCLHREDDPQRIGRDGDFFELPDGGRLIFRRGNPPQYIPSPKSQPVRPYTPPDYNDPTQFE